VATAASKSKPEVAPAEELRPGRTPHGSQLQHDGGPIGGMCRLGMTIYWTLPSASTKRSRAHQQQQEVPGSTYPDHERRAWT
jgi:hypothetical protein